MPAPRHAVRVGDEFAIALTLTHDALVDLTPRDSGQVRELLAHAKLRAHWLLSAAGENEDGQDELVREPVYVLIQRHAKIERAADHGCRIGTGPHHIN